MWYHLYVELKKIFFWTGKCEAIKKEDQVRISCIMDIYSMHTDQGLSIIIHARLLPKKKNRTHIFSWVQNYLLLYHLLFVIIKTVYPSFPCH